MFNVSTEQIEETKRLQKESQNEVVFLKGIHAFNCIYVHVRTYKTFIYICRWMYEKKITQNQNQLHEQIRYDVNIYFSPKNI